MSRYIIRRLLLIIPTTLLVVLLVFLIMNITPGDPGRMILGVGQGVTQEAVDALNHSLGMDRPVMERYFSYIWNILHLDFGLSYHSRQPVLDTLVKSFPITFKLAFLSILVTVVVGIPLGIISAARRYSVLDGTLTVVALVVASVPGFWLGIMLILIFSLKLGLLPTSGVGTLKHYILPVLTLALPNAAFLLRITRVTMLETLRQDYIRTARAKGASEKRVIFRHALKNTLLPVVTTLGLSFANLLGGAIVVEAVFGLPGLGEVILDALVLKDVPVVMASVILIAVLFMLIVLIVDILYAYIDPRIKAQFGGR